jgi:hypothetical protein
VRTLAALSPLLLSLLLAAPTAAAAPPLMVSFPADPKLVEADQDLATGQQIIVKNTTDKPLKIHVTVTQGSARLSEETRALAAAGTYELEIPVAWAGGRVTILAETEASNPGAILSGVVGDAAAAAFVAPLGEPRPPKWRAPQNLPLCSDDQLHPDAAVRARLDLRECHSNDGKRAVICLSPAGRPLVDPKARGAWRELQDKQLVEIRLYTRSSSAGHYNLAVRNERTLIWSPLRAQDLKGAAETWVRSGVVRTRVYGAGWLRVRVNHAAHHERLTDRKACKVPRGDRRVTHHVAKQHYFGAGILIAYVGLKDRSFSLAQGDDGVSRIFEDQADGVDYIANLVAYPLGVEEDKMLQFAPGIVLGTSLELPGRRWYLGLQLELPLGFGLAGGTVVSVVPKLSDDLLVGQPYSGEIPTSDTASFSWWAGINLDLVLFTKFFRSLLSPSVELPQVE